MHLTQNMFYFLDLLAAGGNVNNTTANSNYFPPQQNFGASQEQQQQQQQSADKNNTLQQPTAVMVRKHIDCLCVWYILVHTTYIRRNIPYTNKYSC